jgi:ELWxxDGT repeat protein
VRLLDRPDPSGFRARGGPRHVFSAHTQEIAAMDSVHFTRRVRRARNLRKRWTFSPMRPEVLEGRTLLSLTLLKDINPAPLFPTEITGAGGDVYFVTKAADGGSDLDVQTAAGVRLLKAFPDLNDGDSFPGVSDLTAVGSRLFFSVDVGLGQLWVTNGTSAGTRMVKALSAVMDTTVVGSEVYFVANVLHGKDLSLQVFKSNGTAEGTVPIAMPAGSAKLGNFPGTLVSYGGAIYFDYGNELMKTTGGAAKVVSTFAQPRSNPKVTGFVNNLTVAGGLLYFTFPDAAAQGVDLYASDGTTRGTTALKDFIGSSPYDESGGEFLLSSFTAVGSKLFFGADPAAQGPSLWVSDGTPAGTTFVKALGTPTDTGAGGPGPVGPPIATPTVAGTRLFFTTGSSGPLAAGNELWVSDGTAAGTTTLADINPGNAPLYFGATAPFAAINGALFFANDDPAHGMELWRSDGTAAGTGLFLDINPGTASSFPGNFAVVNNTLYFSATTAVGSSALWSSNGTVTGTNAVASYNSQPQGDALFENIPDAFAVIGNTMVFAADDGTGTELWKTDGTAAGTTIVKALPAVQFATAPNDFTTAGDKAFFVTGGVNSITGVAVTAETLWVTDGTTAGTTEVTTFDGTLTNPMAFDGKLAFIESEDDSSSDPLATALDDTESSLWVSDGTASGTKQLASFLCPSEVLTTDTTTMVILDGKLYFSAAPLVSANDIETDNLWVSDGTTAGTMPIAGIPPSADASTLAVENGKLYFSIENSSFYPHDQLWVTDATAAGTKMILNLGSNFPTINQMVVAGPNL